MFLLDSVYYNAPTFTPLSFIWTNLSGVSLFYGENPWHYYLLQALPILCTTTLPFVLHGAWSALFDATLSKTMIGAVAWTIAVYSLTAHKEWRFIHPILPLLHLFAAKSLVDVSRSPNPSINKNSYPKFSLPTIRLSHLSLILLTIPVSVYIVVFYCSAPISVIWYLQTLPADTLRNGGVGIVMPCHSTPGQAFLNRAELENGRMWALGCEPPLGLG